MAWGVAEALGMLGTLPARALSRSSGENQRANWLLVGERSPPLLLAPLRSPICEFRPSTIKTNLILIEVTWSRFFQNYQSHSYGSEAKKTEDCKSAKFFMIRAVFFLMFTFVWHKWTQNFWLLKKRTLGTLPILHLFYRNKSQEFKYGSLLMIGPKIRQLRFYFWAKLWILQNV